MSSKTNEALLHPIGRIWRPEFSDATQPDIALTCNFIQNLYRCEDLTRIVHLDMRDQHLIPTENDYETALLQSGLAKVTDIAGGDNRLTLKIFTALLSLTHLEMQNNNLTHLPFLSDRDFHHLNSLDISANDLKNDCMESLSRLRRLKTLNLAYNQLTHFHYESSSGFRVLQKLNLTGNRLTSRGLKTLPTLKSLKELNLSRNRIKHIQTLTAKPVLMGGLCFLDLSYNRVTDGSLLVQLEGLRLLSLVENKMSKYQQNLIMHSFRKKSCRILWGQTDEVHLAELSAGFCGKMAGHDTITCVKANEETVRSQKSLVHVCEGDTDLTEEEMPELISGRKSFPRPANLLACYAILNDLQHKPRFSVAGLIPRKIVTKFPLALTKQHHKTFWDAVGGCRDKMERSWMQKDRLSTAEPQELTVKRRKTLTKQQVVKQQLKKYNLENAMGNVLQIDEIVFKELLAYRERIRDNREMIFELEDVLEDF